MQLYDSEIKKILQEFLCESKKNLVQWTQSTREESWPITKKEQLILRSETACELGGENLAAVSGLGFTLEKQLVPKTQVTLLGPDMSQITDNCSYARFTFLRLKESAVTGEDDRLYDLLRRLDYVRYHLHPVGYMMRISARREREPVRLAAKSVKAGMNFAQIGNCFNQAYLMEPEVEAVHTVFITDPAMDYHVLFNSAHRLEQITESLNHIYENLNMDCSTCGLKTVCDEVEGLRQLHSQKTSPLPS